MFTALCCPLEAYTNNLPASADSSAAVHAETWVRLHRGLIQRDVTAADRRRDRYFSIHAHNFIFAL